jgi:hypothetical protein
MDDGDVDSGLLEGVAVLQDAGNATPSLSSGPTVDLKMQICYRVYREFTATRLFFSQF